MSDPVDKKKRATYQDVLDAPEHKLAEIVDGELHLSPRPGAPHTAVGASLFGELQPPFGKGRGGPGGWLFLFEPELHFGEDVVIPDVAAWRQDRMSVVPDEAFFTLHPDWICEVLSASTERIDRLKKMTVYARAGIPFAWLVSPRMRSIEAFRLVNSTWAVAGVYADTDRARIDPFADVELELASLWAHAPLPTRASEPVANYDW